MGQVAYAEKM